MQVRPSGKARSWAITPIQKHCTARILRSTCGYCKHKLDKHNYEPKGDPQCFELEQLNESFDGLTEKDKKEIRSVWRGPVHYTEPVADDGNYTGNEMSDILINDSNDIISASADVDASNPNQSENMLAAERQTWLLNPTSKGSNDKFVSFDRRYDLLDSLQHPGGRNALLNVPVELQLIKAKALKRRAEKPLEELIEKFQGNVRALRSKRPDSVDGLLDGAFEDLHTYILRMPLSESNAHTIDELRRQVLKSFEAAIFSLLKCMHTRTNYHKEVAKGFTYGLSQQVAARFTAKDQEDIGPNDGPLVIQKVLEAFGELKNINKEIESYRRQLFDRLHIPKRERDRLQPKARDPEDFERQTKYIERISKSVNAIKQQLVENDRMKPQGQAITAAGRVLDTLRLRFPALAAAEVEIMIDPSRNALHTQFQQLVGIDWSLARRISGVKVTYDKDYARHQRAAQLITQCFANARVVEMTHTRPGFDSTQVQRAKEDLDELVRLNLKNQSTIEALLGQPEYVISPDEVTALITAELENRFRQDGSIINKPAAMLMPEMISIVTNESYKRGSVFDKQQKVERYVDCYSRLLLAIEKYWRLEKRMETPLSCRIKFVVADGAPPVDMSMEQLERIGDRILTPRLSADTMLAELERMKLFIDFQHKYKNN